PAFSLPLERTARAAVPVQPRSFQSTETRTRLLPKCNSIRGVRLLIYARRAFPLDAVTHIRGNEPDRANGNGNDRKPAAVNPRWRQRLCCLVQNCTVGKHARFGEFVEGINPDLDHEQQEEDRGYLEESLHIDQMAQMNPGP